MIFIGSIDWYCEEKLMVLALYLITIYCVVVYEYWSCYYYSNLQLVIGNYYCEELVQKFAPVRSTSIVYYCWREASIATIYCSSEIYLIVLYWKLLQSLLFITLLILHLPSICKWYLSYWQYLYCWCWYWRYYICYLVKWCFLKKTGI